MSKNDSFEIKGLSGEKTLEGSVNIRGAKNSVLKAMAASILFEKQIRLENVPDTDDIHTLSNILNKLGAKIEVVRNDASDDRGLTLLIDASVLTSTNIDGELARTMRASVVLTGPMLARCGRVSFPAPGGCVIGARPIDLFLSGYESMNAICILDEATCSYNISQSGILNGAEISFQKKSVGATETLMMAAVLAKGKTVLNNCAQEPEIVNLVEWLNKCGAKIDGAGTEVMTIYGTAGKLLKEENIPFVTIPDRIETGSFLILGALCAKNMAIKNCNPDHLKPVIAELKKSGVPIEVVNSGTQNAEIRIVNNTKSNSLFKSFDIKTLEYPGFPTDLQSPIVTYLTQVSGESKIEENIFEGRFKYVDDLVEMGADIKVLNEHEIIVKGPTLLKSNGDYMSAAAHDIRAGFSIVIASLVANGMFIINNVNLIDRGYENLEDRLVKLGADIKRI